MEQGQNSHVYHVTSYGADPTGQNDSTGAILHAIADAVNGPPNRFLMDGIANRGGARIDLDGGNYLITRSVRFPVGNGNLVIHGGSLTASDKFPTDGYLIDLSPAPGEATAKHNYEFITLRDLFLDSKFRGGGIRVVDSLRTSIDNCYITHFNTTGIAVEGRNGHETFIRYSYLGQRITAGNHQDEMDFSGTGILLAGNDNSVTDVVIFSAAVGIMITGQANTLSGVHCYNKATVKGGTGIYLKTQPHEALTQTRIVNSYMDYTGIVAEDPVQLTISSCFFYGDAFILFKSVNGEINGVNVVDNMFSSGPEEKEEDIDIVQLDQSDETFDQVDQVVIDRNNVKDHMKLKSTIARGSVEQGDDGMWTADFNSVLLFPNGIKHVQYTFVTNETPLPVHAVRSILDNKVVIQSNNLNSSARVHIIADQGGAFFPA